ncbi:MAG TPA: molybdenum cofactor biosynthesis protein MoaE [Candidatus Acidoferrales bacterium]|nr:molybdenum cofactor biosynthesis protein MoaE [Candidatus Acidoferrales bacterium]
MVRVRLFARQRELAGTSRLDLAVPEGAAVGDAWTALVVRFPALAPGRPYVRFARNGVYADASERLADGDELACIPPVAGGAGEGTQVGGSDPQASGPERQPSGPEPSGRLRVIQLQADPIDQRTLARLRSAVATPADGAVVTFEGRTRETPGTPAPGEEAEAACHAGQAVLALDYEAYEEMTLTVLTEIADEIEVRFGARRIAMVHRTGRVPLGEDSVAIAVASPHRSAAFDACRYAIDELKGRAPIWKAEHFADGSVWTGETAREAPPPV